MGVVERTDLALGVKEAVAELSPKQKTGDQMNCPDRHKKYSHVAAGCLSEEAIRDSSEACPSVLGDCANEQGTSGTDRREERALGSHQRPQPGSSG